MTDNPINTKSDLEDNIYSSLKRRMKHGSHSLSYVCGDFESKIITLVDNFEM